MRTETPQENYEAVSTLPEEEQRNLVRQGDAQERVWAAWALGLRLGDSSGDVFLEGLRQEPPSGTRMHLAALLAGAGETKAVEALAEHDPSTQVRATAAQYLVKTSAIPNPELVDFLSERLRVECSDVRYKILIETPGKLGAIDAEVYSRCAGDSDRKVRELALPQMEQFPTELASRLLEDRLQTEEDPGLRAHLVRLMVAGNRPEVLLDAARLAPVEQGSELLKVLSEHRVRFEWSRLRALIERQAPTIDSAVLSLASGLEQPEPVAWLISGIARALRLPSAMRREEHRAQKGARDFGDEALTLIKTNLGIWPLQDALEDDLRQLLEYLEAELQYFLDYEDYDEDFDDSDLDLDAEVGELLRQCNVIRGRLGMEPLERSE